MRNDMNVSSRMSRRTFVGAVGAGAAGLAGAAMFGSGTAQAWNEPPQTLVEFVVQTGLNPWLPPYGPSVLQFAHDVNKLLYNESTNTGVRFKIAHADFNTVTPYPTMKGDPEMVFSVPTYIPNAPNGKTYQLIEAGKENGTGAIQACWYTSQGELDDFPLIQMLYSTPFGFTLEEYQDYLYQFGGLEFLKNLIEEEYNLVPLPVTGMFEELGGYFNKPLETFVQQDGKYVRFLGFGGRILKKSYQNLNIYPSLGGGDVQSALSTGLNFNPTTMVLFGNAQCTPVPPATTCCCVTLDGFEFSAWCADSAFWFFNRTDKTNPGTWTLRDPPLPVSNGMVYHYQYAWHQPSSVVPVYINKDMWDKLTATQKVVIRLVARQTFLDCAEYNMAYNNAVRNGEPYTGGKFYIPLTCNMESFFQGTSYPDWPASIKSTLKANATEFYKKLVNGGDYLGPLLDPTGKANYPPNPLIKKVLRHWNFFRKATGRPANPVWEWAGINFWKD